MAGIGRRSFVRAAVHVSQSRETLIISRIYSLPACPSTLHFLAGNHPLFRGFILITDVGSKWCRLALNSAVLGPYLASITQENPQPPRAWVLEALETSLTAAMQIIFCVSTLGHDYVWKVDSQDASTVPSEPFTVDQTTFERLSYAVDSTWVSYTFAVTFLAFCYVKSVVDGG